MSGPSAGQGEEPASDPLQHPLMIAFANNLENYWKHGKGALKIRWGTPGDWTRCHRHLTKHVGDERAKRICAQWHHEVTGRWPSEGKS